MAFINLRQREIQIKIVYYGPPGSGKTATLRHINSRLSGSLQSRLLTISPDGTRTVFLDFLAFTVPDIHGFDLKVRLYTVPGHPQYAAVRRTLLKGTDGIVFVADPSAMRKTNMMALLDLCSNLLANGKNIARIPLVFQINKSDLSGAHCAVLPASTLLHDLNSEYRRPYFAASAAKGKNVFTTLKTIIAAVLDQVETRYNEAESERRRVS
jgi:signal recognition particle receptor subunit beta